MPQNGGDDDAPRNGVLEEAARRRRHRGDAGRRRPTMPDNLAPTFVAEMTRLATPARRWGGRSWFGDIVDDTSGALWRRDWIEAHRVARRAGASGASSSPSTRR